jgi:hypothetical protein
MSTRQSLGIESLLSCAREYVAAMLAMLMNRFSAGRGLVYDQKIALLSVRIYNFHAASTAIADE